MKYCSIDIETTGLDPHNDQILEVGVIIEDTNNQLPYEEIPKFNVIIKHERLSGSPFALNMNKRIIKIISDIPKHPHMRDVYLKKHNIINEEELGLRLFTFLTSHGYEDDYDGAVKIIVAGKNFGSFDKIFLDNVKLLNGFVKFGHKYIDPVTLYTNFLVDTELPSLHDCKERGNIKGIVTHKAIDDAWDVIEVLRKKY